MNAIRRLLLALALSMGVSQALAQEGAQGIVHILDYLGVDYGGAVKDGQVASDDEYREMLEFSAQARDRIRALPANAQQKGLIGQASELAELVQKKASAADVSAAAAKLRWKLIDAYSIQVAPKAPPKPAGAAALYAQQCASCHGAQGRGDGPAAKGLEPPPSNFHDAARMSQRSAYGLYNTISLGVKGTAMQGFGQISEADRWALAFLVGSFGVASADARQGERLWKGGGMHSAFPDMSAVATLSRNEAVERFGEKGGLVHDFLRVDPEAVLQGKPDPLQYARDQLARALELHRRGDREAAREAATAAYLEGFELIESALDNVDKPLRHSIEREMLAVRAAISEGAGTASLEKQVATADALLAQAHARLSDGELGPEAAFGSSAIILLREGLEAILLLAAIIAFVSRTGRREALAWVHAGWIAALVLGAATWAVATYVIDVSGASREVTEGVTALLAAAMLIYVGYWLHGKTQAKAWSEFIRERVGQALERKALWAIAGISFLTVYREIFEVVLFYQALWVQAGPQGHGAIFSGIGAATACLAVFGWAFFRYSVRLPLGPFFSALSVLIALMAIVFAGQGVAALQEAGKIGISPVEFVDLPVLGVHSTAESLAAQVAVAALVLFSFWASRRRSS